MRVFESLKYYEFEDLSVGQFFTIGRSREMYKVIDYAKHWNDYGMYDKIMVVTDSKNRYKVFKCADLEGKRVTVY